MLGHQTHQLWDKVRNPRYEYIVSARAPMTDMCRSDFGVELERRTARKHDTDCNRANGHVRKGPEAIPGRLSLSVIVILWSLAASGVGAV